jgi:hypothetical protein
MLKPVALAFSLAAGAALLSAPALSEDGGRKFDTTLTGAAEVPGPGDADGGGSANLTINPGQGQVCYTLSVSDIDPATMAHIHKAAVGVAGPVVVALRAPTNGSSKACATVGRPLALDILKSPADYYVNVHNQPFPSGAIRGQLAK